MMRRATRAETHPRFPATRVHRVVDALHERDSFPVARRKHKYVARIAKLNPSETCLNFSVPWFRISPETIYVIPTMMSIPPSSPSSSSPCRSFGLSSSFPPGTYVSLFFSSISIRPSLSPRSGARGLRYRRSPLSLPSCTLRF